MPDPLITLVLGTSTGGVGTHVRSLAAGLSTLGWRVRVCGPAATEELFDFTGTGAQFSVVPVTGSFGDLAAVHTLRRATLGSSIVHAHGLRAATVAAMTGARPLVVTWHNAVLTKSAPARALLAVGERFVAHRANVSLAASDDLARRIRALGGRDVRDSPIAITAAVPKRAAAAVRAELGLTRGQLLVVTVARLHPQKGLDVLIAAATRWPKSQAVVVIAGDGPLRSALAAQIAASGAPVQLLGRRRDVADLLGAADVVALPSRWEARSLVAQETLLVGRALVATAVGGMPELLGSGAILVAPDDVEALATAIGSLLADPDERSVLAVRGRAQAAGWPTEGDTVAQTVAVYRELIGQH
jgi:glycosyltransferase involved in cell wall biosynthesis